MRIALNVEYDGTDFCGWQTQKDCRSVQQEVERAVSTVADQPVSVVCAGRTDTGVHASGQIIHFDVDVIRKERNWVLGCNANLPRDVSISWAKEVKDDFHARFSATARSYRYVILNRMTRSAIYRNRVSWHHQPLDEIRMNMAAKSFLGEQDFTSFRALACQAKHAVRMMHEINVERKGDFIIIDVRANAFLHHMVRNIAGTLIAIGEGEQDIGWVQELLDAKDRAQAGITAPPHGLYLVNVEYPSEFELPVGCAAPTFY